MSGINKTQDQALKIYLTSGQSTRNKETKFFLYQGPMEAGICCI